MNRRITKDVETSCEYVLPDYMGDIKKLLFSRARAVPSGKYLSGEVLEVNGAVEYELLYADADGRLTSISTSGDYALSLPVDGDRYSGCECAAAVANLSVRITGPRKVLAKATLRGTFSVTEDGAPEVRGDVFNSGARPEVDTRVINSERYIYSEELEREYADEAERLEGLAGEDVEVIAASGEIRILETRPVEGGVEIRGELAVFAIVRTPEQPPFRIVKVIPFVETVSIDGATDSAVAVASGCVRQVGIDVGEDGEDKVLVANATVLLSGCVIENEAVEVVTDAYLTDARTASAYEKLEYSIFLEELKGEIKVEHRLDADALGTEEVHSVIWLSGDVRDFACDTNEDKSKISGAIQLSGIACEINADKSIGYIPIKASVPFEQYVNINSQNVDELECHCVCGAPVCDFVIDGTSLHLRAEIPYVIRKCGRGHLTRLAECSKTGEVQEHRKSVITVYYPTEGDTLFSVAKKYATTTSKLALDNPSVESVMAGADVSSVGRLIIK